MRIKRVVMKTQTQFKDLEVEQRFYYLGRSFTKKAFSLAADQTDDQFIFMGQIKVEAEGSEEGRLADRVCA